MLLAEVASLVVEDGFQGPRTSLVAVRERSSWDSQVLEPRLCSSSGKVFGVFFFFFNLAQVLAWLPWWLSC